MYCPSCGKELPDNAAFCKYCGARLGGSTPPPPPADKAPPPETGPAWAQPTPPPPPAGGQTPPQPPVGWAPPPVVQRGGRGLGIILIAAAAVVILAGGGLAAVLVTRAGSDGPTTATSSVATTPEQTLADDQASTTDEGGASTTATIPGYDPGTTTDVTTGTSGEGTTEAYVAALDGLEAVLAYADTRIPELAQQINASAPRVPDSVDQELQSLFAQIDDARVALGELQPPPEYQRADELLFEAADIQQYRIDQTRQGIDAMWLADDVDAGLPYFDEGRKARDDYRRVYDQYKAIQSRL